MIGAFFEVYNTLGFGFLEHVYLDALAIELRARGHPVAREVRVRVTYKGVAIGWQRLDMIVDNTMPRTVGADGTRERRHFSGVSQGDAPARGKYPCRQDRSSGEDRCA